MSKAGKSTVNLFYLGSVLAFCLFLNPKLGCVICQGEFLSVYPKPGISLPLLYLPECPLEGPST